MPDDTNQAAAAGTNPGAGENGKSDANQKPDAAAGSGEASGEGEGGAGKPGAVQAKAPQTKVPDDSDDDGKEPPTRQGLTPKDFIIQRQQKKIAKMATAPKDDEDTEDDQIAPEDEDLITKVVAKRFGPILEKTLSAEDDREISAFLTANPDFKPFEVKARRYISHPSRRHLPIESVFYEVAGKKLLQIGAKRQVAADAEAKATATGGGTSRGGKTGKGVWDMTPQEFEAHKQRIRTSQQA